MNLIRSVFRILVHDEVVLRRLLVESCQDIAFIFFSFFSLRARDLEIHPLMPNSSVGTREADRFRRNDER